MHLLHHHPLWGILLALSTCVVLAFSESLPLGSGRPNPAFVTSVTQTSAYNFTVHIQMPKLSHNIGIADSNNINNSNNSIHDITVTTTTLTPTLEYKYKLYVLAPKNSLNSMIPIPFGGYTQLSDTQLQIHVQEFCYHHTEETITSTTTSCVRTPVHQDVAKDGSALIMSPPPSTCEFPLSLSSSTTTTTSSSCPFAVWDDIYYFTLGVTVLSADEIQESFVTWFPSSDMNLISLSQQHPHINSINIAEPAQLGLDIQRDMRWIIVLAVMLPICVTLVLLVLYLWYQVRTIQSHTISHPTTTNNKNNIPSMVGDNYQVNPVVAVATDVSCVVDMAEAFDETLHVPGIMGSRCQPYSEKLPAFTTRHNTTNSISNARVTPCV